MKWLVEDDQLAKRLVEAAGCMPVHGNFRGAVFFDRGKIIGAGIFTNYVPNWSCEYTATLSDGYVGVRIARLVAHYVFITMGCHRCTAITRRDNVRAQTALRKIGFVFEGIMREHFPGRVDGFVYGLLRTEQRLIRCDNGRW